MGSGTIAPTPGESVLEAQGVALLCDWWAVRRPGWVDPSWWSMPMRPEVAALLRLPAGPKLLAVLQRLAVGICPVRHAGEAIPGDPAPGSAPGFPCGCQLVLIAAWRAVTDWAAVRAGQAVVAAVGTEPVEIEGDGNRPGMVDPAREELAAATRLTQGTAAVVVRRSRALAAFPQAAELAAEGVLPLRTVETVCESASRLSEMDGQDVIQRWCRAVRGRSRGRQPMTARGAARCANRLIVAAPSHQGARRRARRGRRVELWADSDGTATLAAVLPEEDAHRAYRRLTAIANGLDDPADDRPIDARRADALIDVLLGTMLSQPTGVEVNVTVPAATLFGLADDPGEVPGLGPIPAEVARELAADARWRAWVTDAAGAVEATSSTTYRPSAALARRVRARHPECRMVGCRRPADACDLDHAKPWPEGATTMDNLGPLCRRHHVMKTHYGWEMVPESGIWRTPAGAEVPLVA
jgi:hypothetical protein